MSMASRSDGGTVAAMASFVCFTLTSVPVRLRLPEPTLAGIRVVPRVAATPAIVEADSAVRHRPRGLYKLLPSASSSQQNGPYRFRRRLTATSGTQKWRERTQWSRWTSGLERVGLRPLHDRSEVIGALARMPAGVGWR